MYRSFLSSLLFFPPKIWLVKQKGTKTKAACYNLIATISYFFIQLGSLLFNIIFAAHKPRLWVEEDKANDTYAAMMVLYPEFNVGVQKNTEYIVAVDRYTSPIPLNPVYPLYYLCIFILSVHSLSSLAYSR